MVIGTNASGKSNLLDAFAFLSLLAKGRPVEEALNSIRGGNDWVIQKEKEICILEVCVSQTVQSTEYVYSVSLAKRDNRTMIVGETLIRKNSFGEKTLFCTNEQPAVSSPTIDIRFYTAKRGNARRIDLGRTTSVLSQVPTLGVLKEVVEADIIVLSNLAEIFVLNPIPDRMRGYSPLDTSLKSDASNLAGVLSAMPDSIREQLEQKLSDSLRPLPERDINRVWTERVGKFSSDAMLYCEEQWTDSSKTIIDSRSMSDGTLRFLAIVTAILTAKKGCLLIIEEVDNGLHPSRAKELVTMLRTLGAEQGVDILCTTHNPVLLDKMGVEMIPFVFYIKRDPQTGGSVALPLEDKENLPKLLAQYGMGDLMTEDKL
jgi:predicted ATPase